MSVLALDGVSLAIGGTPILDDIALEVDGGEIVGLIGESGSGKSLTALSILQLLPHGARLSGSIRLGADELVGLNDRALSALRGDEIAMIFQEPMTALNPTRTIGDQVAETVRVHRKASRREAMRIARETLDRVELPADRFPLDRYPHELSGGQRQRVGIAMAIALRPQVLIADEPTTALDVTTQAQILALLRRLVREDGMGLILITHDLAIVADMADRLVILKDGRVVEAGGTLDVFTRMRHPYTRALYAASRHVPKRAARPAEAAPVLLGASSLMRDYALPRRLPWHRKRLFRAVDDVSFTVARGENLGLVGESGSGKSTLARAVLGLDPLSGGAVTIGGLALQGSGANPHAARRKIQAVFQDPYGSFNPRHTVARLVAEPFHLLGGGAPDARGRRAAVDRVLEQVGLKAGDGEKYIHEFSGGQRQRIAIARALIIEPDLIVLDEAVSALDVSVRAQILDLLAGLSDRLGVSYLFISHDLHVVRAITDRVLVMRGGRIVEAGPTEAVFRAPSHPYTRQLLAAAPDLDTVLAARRSEAP